MGTSNEARRVDSSCGGTKELLRQEPNNGAESVKNGSIGGEKCIARSTRANEKSF